MKTLIGVMMMATTFAASAAPKVLVVFSSETKITVMNNGKPVEHPTGFFLSELMVPLKALIAAGFEPVYASPKGGTPVMDKVSDSAFWFGNDEREYRSVRADYEALGITTRPLS